MINGVPLVSPLHGEFSMESQTVVTVVREDIPAGYLSARSPAATPPPVVKPKMSFPRLLGEILAHGGPGYLQFAITNICNARCDFCGFAADKFDPRQRRTVALEQARDLIDILVKNHIGYLLFVGGEPLVHKDLDKMTRYAAERGIRPM